MNFFHVTCFISIFIVIATPIASNDPPPVNAEDTSDNVQVFYEEGWFKRVGGAISEIPQDPDNEESTIHPEASPPPSTTTSTPPNLLQPHHSHELGAYFFFHVFNITFLLTQCLIFVTSQFPDPSISECPPSFLGYRDGILVRSASPLCHHTQDRLYPQSPCCLPVSDVNWFRPWVIERSHLPVTVHQPLGHPPGWTRSVVNRVSMLL